MLAVRPRAAHRANAVSASKPSALAAQLASPDNTPEFIKADHYLQEPATARAQTAGLITAWVASRVH
jgi:hypothetical protein